jgi:hypothetical protein
MQCSFLKAKILTPIDPQQLLIKTVTIDELLGINYQPLLGQKDSTYPAALRLAAWCLAASRGD